MGLIQFMINSLELTNFITLFCIPDSRHAFLSPADHFKTKVHFHKRRMSDVTSVFAVIGCCEKSSLHSRRWVGLSRIPFAIRKPQCDAPPESRNATLRPIIRSGAMVSMAALTIRFILCFLQRSLVTMDIRQISRYLPRKTGQ
jgi:hypothetical protein